MNYSSSVSDFNIESKKIRIQGQNVNEHLSFDNTEKCLYLDGGNGAWVIGLESFLDEYYPIPLQRIAEGSQFEGLYSHIRAKEKALSYAGKYISVDELWFFNGKNTDISNKIKLQYSKFDRAATYSLSWDIFKRPKEDDIVFLDLFERVY